ncbi:MAG: alpha/beta fold hydrolase [Spirulina sp. SIO3F2]|nr:alpha/beta fold hydrolase [Spirulina sp. SIO3F2]
MKMRWLPRFLGMVIINGSLLWGGVVQAAETIVFSISALEFSIAVDSLAHYAQTGKIKPDLSDVAAHLSDEQLTQLREVLDARVDVDPVVVSQFLYSPQGEAVLGEIGELILTRKRQSGFYALRSALILAAADPEGGLTPLNVMRKFPVDGIRIDSTFAFDLMGQVGRNIADTQVAIATIEQQAQQQAATAPDTSFPLDLRQAGSLEFEQSTLILNDLERERIFSVDLYVPRTATVQPAPLVIISHGLGSDRSTFVYLARHLASHGFAVAVPEHPGSNAAQIQALAAGTTNELTPPSELVDRPLDVQFLLDHLATKYSDRVRTQTVGVIGQSFGAYTALALAGAELNLPRLADTCPQALYTLNWSLVLQCSALKLTEPIPTLQDERVAAVVAINPLTSQIFGPEQLSAITIPVLLISGGADTVTPALPEQIQPFNLFSPPNRYLALLSQGTHFSTLAESDGDIPLPSAVLGPDPTIAQAYVRALGLGFFGSTVAGRSELQTYLSASYAAQISNTVNRLSLVEAQAQVE